MKKIKSITAGISGVLLPCIVCWVEHRVMDTSFFSLVYGIYFSLLILTAAMGASAGVIHRFIKGTSSTGWNALKIFAGNFCSDGHISLFKRICQVVSKHSWEFPQTALGNTWLQLQNIFSSTARADHFGGATFLTIENHSKKQGVSFGSFIQVFIKDEITGVFEKKVISDMMFIHEYGHTFDSRIFGIFYLILIGLPSLISAATYKAVADGPKGLITHYLKWYEISANRHASQYFGKYYGINWSAFENIYPLKKEQKKMV